MKLTLDGAQTIVSLNLEEARETAKYDHRTSEYWPTLIGERLWFLNMLNNIETELKHAYVIVDEDGNMECSNCGSSNCFDSYCGNCGAKLVGTRKDGEENG
jgi:hypothetical protein